MYHIAIEDSIPLGELLDALVEHDPDDPAFGDPANWPAEWDDDVVMLGAPLTREETFDPLPDDDGDDLTF